MEAPLSCGRSVVSQNENLLLRFLPALSPVFLGLRCRPSFNVGATKVGPALSSSQARDQLSLGTTNYGAVSMGGS